MGDSNSLDSQPMFRMCVLIQKADSIKESSLNVITCLLETWTDYIIIGPCRIGQETYAWQKYWYGKNQARMYSVGKDFGQQGLLQTIKIMC